MRRSGNFILVVLLFVFIIFNYSCKKYVLISTSVDSENDANVDDEEDSSLTSEIDEISSVIVTHLDRENELYALAFNYPFYYYPGEEKWGIGASYNKRLVFSWISDVHGGEIEYGRFIKYSNTYKDVIDFMISTGDFSKLAPRDGGWANTQDKYAGDSFLPILICLGNHDITGNLGNEIIFDSLEELDDELIMPWEKQISWTNKGRGSYYYKDFKGESYIYRVIMLNDFERPRLVSEGSWETITYDDSLPDYSLSSSYYKGDRVNHQSHSYKAVKSSKGEVPTRLYFDYVDGRYISKDQAEWLCNALSTMPMGCKAIVCSHMMIGPSAPVHCNFTYPYGDTRGCQMCQNGNVLVDILSAFIKRESVSTTYEMMRRMPAGRTDGEIIEGFSYSLNYDFSSIPEAVDVKCCLAGHKHIDMITTLDVLPSRSLYNIMITSGSPFYQCGDLGVFGERGRDAFNIASVDSKNGFKMMRIGQDMTDIFTRRDNIVLDF